MEDEFDEDAASPLPLLPDDLEIQHMKRKTSIFKYYSQKPGGKCRRTVQFLILFLKFILSVFI